MFYQQGNIKTTASGDFTVGSLNKLRKTLGLNGFFDDKKDSNLLNTRVKLMAEFIRFNSRSINSTGNQVKQLKDWFLHYKSQTHVFNSLFRIVYHLKGTNRIYSINHVESELFSILEQLPANEWTSYKNIKRFARIGIEPK